MLLVLKFTKGFDPLRRTLEPTPKRLREVLEELGWNKREDWLRLATAAGISRRTMGRYLSGEQVMPLSSWYGILFVAEKVLEAAPEVDSAS